MQMDARSLAVELAPIIMWQRGQRPEHYKQIRNQSETLASKTKMDSASNDSAWEILSGKFATYASTIHNKVCKCGEVAVAFKLILSNLCRI